MVTKFLERFYVDWNEFCQALLIEYMLENATRVKMKTFLEWTNKGGKSLSISKLLTEFENNYCDFSAKD